MSRIDLNCDLGEAVPGTPRWADSQRPGAGADPGDEALLDAVTSANVACGFHAGNRATMAATAAAAGLRGVTVGAHPSYRDRENFGRIDVDVNRDQLVRDVLAQIVELDAAARRNGVRVRYVKPHGALYNRLVADTERAAAVVEAILRFAVQSGEPPLPVLGPPGSELLRVARENGVAAHTEAFADRGYRPDGTLVPRGEPGAVLHDPGEVAERVAALALGLPVDCVGGGSIEVAADSVCVHGDTPGAVALARAVRSRLDAEGVEVTSFVSGVGER